MLTLRLPRNLALRLASNHVQSPSSEDLSANLTSIGSSRQITGYSSEDNVDRNLFELIHPDDLQPARDLFARLLRVDTAMTISDLRHRHKDGSWRRIVGIATNLLHETDMQAIVFNYRDITERKLVEASLQGSENRYRGLFEDSPVSLWEGGFFRDPASSE